MKKTRLGYSFMEYILLEQYSPDDPQISAQWADIIVPDQTMYRGICIFYTLNITSGAMKEPCCSLSVCTPSQLDYRPPDKVWGPQIRLQKNLTVLKADKTFFNQPYLG